jgi:hypothetical protein
LTILNVVSAKEHVKKSSGPRFIVMAALEAAIQQTKTQAFNRGNWMAGSSPAMTKEGDADSVTRSFAGKTLSVRTSIAADMR